MAAAIKLLLLQVTNKCRMKEKEMQVCTQHFDDNFGRALESVDDDGGCDHKSEIKHCCSFFSGHC